MRNKINFLSLIVLLFVLTQLFGSCSSSDKIASQSSLLQKRKYTKGYYINPFANKNGIVGNNIIKKSSSKTSANTDQLLASTNDDLSFLDNNNKQVLIVNDSLEGNTKSVTASNDSCDMIILRNGDSILAINIETSLSTIKYSDCNNSTEPRQSINKSNVLLIRHINGKKEFFYSKIENNNTNKIAKSPDKKDVKKIQPLSLASSLMIPLLLLVSLILIGCVGFFFYGMFLVGLFFGLMSIITGYWGAAKIHKYPDKYKGKSNSLMGIILGIAVTAISLVGVFLWVFNI